MTHPTQPSSTPITAEGAVSLLREALQTAYDNPGGDHTDEIVEQALAATDPAAIQQAGEAVQFCPACGGSGEVSGVEGSGPDQYEISVTCPHCNGNALLLDAYTGVVALLRAEQSARQNAQYELYAATFRAPQDAKAEQAKAGHMEWRAGHEDRVNLSRKNHVGAGLRLAEAIAAESRQSASIEAGEMRTTISNAIYGYGCMVEDHAGVVDAIAKALLRRDTARPAFSVTSAEMDQNFAFNGKRLRAVAAMAGRTYDGMSDEQIDACRFAILGDIRRGLEPATKPASTAPATGSIGEDGKFLRLLLDTQSENIGTGGGYGPAWRTLVAYIDARQSVAAPDARDAK